MLVQYPVVVQVRADGAAVIGQTGLHPVEAMDGRALTGQRGENPGPPRHPGVLLGRGQEGETVTPHLEDGRDRPRPAIDEHAHAGSAVVRRAVHELQSVEGGVRRRGAGGRQPPGSGARHRCHVDDLTGVGTGRRLEPVTGDPCPSPSGHDRQPLLAGATGDRPERQRHGTPDPGDSQDDARQGRPTPDRQDSQDQSTGDGRHLPGPPTGDDPTSLQWREPVADA